MLTSPSIIAWVDTVAFWSIGMTYTWVDTVVLLGACVVIAAWLMGKVTQTTSGSDATETTDPEARQE